MGRKLIKHIDDIKAVEEFESESDISGKYGDSEDESYSSSSSIVMTKKPVKQKAVKEKKPYVLTPARKAQFEKARIKRAENIEIKKQMKSKEKNMNY